ncbi:hypothetical protein ACIBSW_07100 [Actinoplanes sp. NPDC049668]|uniref:hypothetical protein n=1 Tax=unclassified Actinoplanes TaxID=2626549 RepID=UPI0033AFC700
MTARTMRQVRRDATAHTDWCAQDHRCNLGEHRSPETIVDLPGHGRTVVTRVRTADGREHAEIRARIALHSTDTGARWQLRTLLGGLDRLLRHVAVRPGVLRTGAEQPAIGRRAA